MQKFGYRICNIPESDDAKGDYEGDMEETSKYKNMPYPHLDNYSLNYNFKIDFS